MLDSNDLQDMSAGCVAWFVGGVVLLTVFCVLVGVLVGRFLL